MFVLISGTTCSGKSTVADLLQKQGFERVITSTTRPQRPDESDSAYHFYAADEFRELIDKNLLLEHNIHDGNAYGVSLASLAKFDNKDLAVLVIEPNGHAKAKKYLQANGFDLLSVFLNASPKSRICRLLDREKDTDAVISRFSAMLDTESGWGKELRNYDMMLETDVTPPDGIVEIIMRHVNARNKNSLSKVG